MSVRKPTTLAEAATMTAEYLGKETTSARPPLKKVVEQAVADARPTFDARDVLKSTVSAFGLSGQQVETLRSLIQSLLDARITIDVVKNRSSSKAQVAALMPLLGSIKSCDANGTFAAILA
jgi:hypothetical protein